MKFVIVQYDGYELKSKVIEASDATEAMLLHLQLQANKLDAELEEKEPEAVKAVLKGWTSQARKVRGGAVLVRDDDYTFVVGLKVEITAAHS